MTALRGLQRDLQRHVLEFDQCSLKTVSRHVVSTEKVSADVRLSIYANGYRLRLIEALATEFSTLQRITGEKTFDALCRSFIAAHPSRTPNLRWYGGELAAHLACTAPFNRRPVLAEVARFEWAIGLAFDAADDKALTFEEVAALPPQSWPAMVFSLHPSVQRLDLAWNAPDLFKATDSGAAVKPRRAPAPRHWCIWRRELTPRYRRLPADEAWMLDAVARGESFAAICEGLTRWTSESAAAARAATLLRTWIAEQMVSTVRIDVSKF
ncbi:MAG: DNA-binding domain-containing protein [Pseudomonadota bacterium]